MNEADSELSGIHLIAGCPFGLHDANVSTIMQYDNNPEPAAYSNMAFNWCFS